MASGAMMQSRKHSLLEAIGNTGTGFVISLFVQDVIINAYYGLPIGFNESVVITCAFTAISVVRSYVWRRGMERYHRRGK